MTIRLKNFQKKIPVFRIRIIKAASLALEQLGLECDLSIAFVGPVRMRRLNHKYLGHDYVTDVLTFALEGAAEIIICPQQAQANARRYGTSVQKELVLYVIHGILHRAGYDDRRPKDIQVMRAKEEEFIEKLKF